MDESEEPRLMKSTGLEWKREKVRVCITQIHESPSRREWFKMVLQIAEIAILAVTLYYAKKIGDTQNQINRALYDLQARPSLDVSYLPRDGGGRLQISNKGPQDIWVCGTKVFGVDKEVRCERPPKFIEKETGSGEIDDKPPRLEESLKKMDATIEVYFKYGSGEQYVAKILLRQNTSGDKSEGEIISISRLEEKQNTDC